MRIPYIASLFGIALALTVECSDETRHSSLPPARNVDAGHIEYSDGPLKSDDFCHCSAVIVRFGGSAFLAHALPGPVSSHPRPVDITNVVERLIDESHKRNLDIRQSEAIICTDNICRQNYLERKLRAAGFPVRSRVYVDDDVSLSTDLYYLPDRDILLISPKVNLKRLIK